MTTVLIVVAFIICELLLFGIVFRLLGKVFLRGDSTTKEAVEAIDFFKGLLERLVLAVALANGIPQILIFFGAMKVATRLKTDTDSAQFNNFFLVGNLTSVFVAIQYSIHLNSEANWLQYLESLIRACFWA